MAQMAAARRRSDKTHLDVWVVPIFEYGVQCLPYTTAVLWLVQPHAARKEQQLACTGGGGAQLQLGSSARASSRPSPAQLQPQQVCHTVAWELEGKADGRAGRSPPGVSPGLKRCLSPSGDS